MTTIGYTRSCDACGASHADKDQTLCADCRARLRVEFSATQPRDKTRYFRGGLAIGSTGAGDDGWLARIELAPGLYLQLFPKYGLVAMEVHGSGNQNLPAGCMVDKLLGHLFKAIGEDEQAKELSDKRLSRMRVRRVDVIAAIRTLKEVARAKHEEWGLDYRDTERGEVEHVTQDVRDRLNRLMFALGQLQGAHEMIAGQLRCARPDVDGLGCLHRLHRDPSTMCDACRSIWHARSAVGALQHAIKDEARR